MVCAIELLARIFRGQAIKIDLFWKETNRMEQVGLPPEAQ